MDNIHITCDPSEHSRSSVSLSLSLFVEQNEPKRVLLRLLTRHHASFPSAPIPASLKKEDASRGLLPPMESRLCPVADRICHEGSDDGAVSSISSVRAKWACVLLLLPTGSDTAAAAAAAAAAARSDDATNDCICGNVLMAAVGVARIGTCLLALALALAPPVAVTPSFRPRDSDATEWLRR